MKIGILTSHNPRHIYLANELSKIADSSMIISSAMGLNPATSFYKKNSSDLMLNYFNDRFKSELDFFPDRYFNGHKQYLIVVGSNEINNIYVYEQLKEYNPDIIVVFGTNILKGEILTINQKIINLHLGMSPYFNGSSTNFWPMYNYKYEYVGITIHYIDAGVDTGNIIHQSRAKIESNDTPHTIGNKNILLGVSALKDIIPIIINEDIKGIKQWKVNQSWIPKMMDFTNEIQEEFTNRISNGEINIWLNTAIPKEYKLVKFNKKPIITNSSIYKPIEINF